MSQKELEDYLLQLPNTWLDYPFGEGVAVYKVGGKDDKRETNPDTKGRGKMFAIISETAIPLRVSLKCDPELAVSLREKYETILPGYHLNKKHWNTVICSGQLSDTEILDLARHSYELVKS